MPRDDFQRPDRSMRLREATFAAGVADRYAAAARELGYDCLSTDGRRAIELKFALHGVRDLDAAVTQLALALTRSPGLDRMTLLAHVGRLNAERVRAEWERVLAVLRPEVADRMALVALAVDGVVLEPRGDDELAWLAAKLRGAMTSGAHDASRAVDSVFWTGKSFDVWMVLLDAWLRCEAPLAIGDIAKRSGCSHPTVTATLRRLMAHGELTRTSSRRAGFVQLPRGSLGEVLVLSDGLRGTQRFVDGSGRPEPIDLARRIRERAPKDIAIGGVVAARHYAPNFDLNGLPRIDVTTRRDGDVSAWVSAIDPALRRATLREKSPVLVVHHSRRAAVFDDADTPEGRVMASPAETLLDLYDLRLTEQADDFARSLRKKGEKHV